MPDDNDKEIAEQEDKDEMDAEGIFDDEDGEEDKTKKKDSEDSKDSKDDESDDDDDAGDDEEDEEGEDDELTPKQIAEKLAGLREDKKKAGESNNPLLDFIGSDEDEDEEEEEEEEKPSPKKKSDKKADEDLELDDDDFDLKEYKQSYPEDYNAILKIATGIANRMLESKESDKEKPDYATREELGHTIARLELRLDVTRKHPDAEKITEIDDKGNLVDEDFAAWINDQPKAIQRLFVNDGDTRQAVENFIAGLDFYKWDLDKKKGEDHDDSARKEKKKKDDLHSHTMRSKKKGRKSKEKTEKEEEAEAEEIFEED